MLHVDDDNIQDAEGNMLRRLWAGDAHLTTLGLAMFGLLAVTGVALALDPRAIGGAPAWLKPAKFAVSIGIYALTLAWVFTYLPAWTRTRRIVSRVTVATFVIEIVIIDIQAWRGTTSHFNVGTPLDGALFSVMGLAIIAQTLATASVALALWRQPFQDRTLGWALRFGTTIALIGGLAGGLMTRPTPAQLDAARSGQRMTIVGAHTVGAPDGGPGLVGTGWSRTHGDLRVAHFLGLHAFQLIPLVSVVIGRRRWSDTQKVRMIVVASASYAGLFVLLTWQALRGQPITTPDVTTLTAFAVWGALTAVAMWGVSHPPDSARLQVMVS